MATSVKMLTVPFRYHTTTLLRQEPPVTDLFQKKETGVQVKTLPKKAQAPYAAMIASRIEQ